MLDCTHVPVHATMQLKFLMYPDIHLCSGPSFSRASSNFLLRACTHTHTHVYVHTQAREHTHAHTKSTHRAWLRISTGRDVSNGTFRIDATRTAFVRAARKLEALARGRKADGSINYLSVGAACMACCPNLNLH